MRKRSRFFKGLTLAATCGLLWQFGGGCLPDNFFADKLGEIVNGVIIFGVNSALAGTGVTI